MAQTIPPYKFLKRLFETPQLVEDTRIARDRANADPLCPGCQFQLDLVIPKQNQGGRPLPSVFSGRTDKLATLELVEALQAGEDYLSQVWTAKVVGVTDTCLVMKILQPSLGRFPWLDESYQACELADNEAWVYRNLADRQGLSIPYFYGLSQIKTPCGEVAWALVLEFIPGPTMTDVIELESVCIPDIQECCKLGVAAVRDLAESGWRLRDIRCRNFMVPGKPGARTVVLIDLFDTEPQTPTKKFVDF
ncbi:hypothetical protein DFH06DRAFT_573553 [Mycena polygramma]|nr:hypothetical protein DFH06DRAFT_573553 [Mycena polygramma]